MILWYLCCIPSCTSPSCKATSCIFQNLPSVMSMSLKPRSRGTSHSQPCATPGGMGWLGFWGSLEISMVACLGSKKGGNKITDIYDFQRYFMKQTLLFDWWIWIFFGYLWMWSHAPNHRSLAANWLQDTPHAAIVVSSAFLYLNHGIWGSRAKCLEATGGCLAVVLAYLLRFCLFVFLRSSPEAYFLLYLLRTFIGNSHWHEQNLFLTYCGSLLESMMLPSVQLARRLERPLMWHHRDRHDTCLCLMVAVLVLTRAVLCPFFLPCKRVLLPSSRANLPPRIFQHVTSIFRSWHIRKHTISESTIE